MGDPRCNNEPVRTSCCTVSTSSHATTGSGRDTPLQRRGSREGRVSKSLPRIIITLQDKLFSLKSHQTLTDRQLPFIGHEDRHASQPPTAAHSIDSPFGDRDKVVRANFVPSPPSMHTHCGRMNPSPPLPSLSRFIRHILGATRKERYSTRRDELETFPAGLETQLSVGLKEGLVERTYTNASRGISSILQSAPTYAASSARKIVETHHCGECESPKMPSPAKRRL